jgi:hypothetical protein
MKANRRFVVVKFGIAVLRSGRVSAFTFFSIKIPLKAACFEERIYRKVEEVEEVKKKGKKEKNRGPHGRNGLIVSNVCFVRVGLCLSVVCFEEEIYRKVEEVEKVEEKEKKKKNRGVARRNTEFSK